MRARSLVALLAVSSTSVICTTTKGLTPKQSSLLDQMFQSLQSAKNKDPATTTSILQRKSDDIETVLIGVSSSALVDSLLDYSHAATPTLVTARAVYTSPTTTVPLSTSQHGQDTTTVNNFTVAPVIPEQCFDIQNKLDKIMRSMVELSACTSVVGVTGCSGHPTQLTSSSFSSTVATTPASVQRNFSSVASDEVRMSSKVYTNYTTKSSSEAGNAASKTSTVVGVGATTLTSMVAASSTHSVNSAPNREILSLVALAFCACGVMVLL